jgi:hypothetical protein
MDANSETGRENKRTLLNDSATHSVTEEVIDVVTIFQPIHMSLVVWN